ncbi:MAG TPA: hypothetical protein VEU51_03585, partial [Candidatus Acidoferrales bacterium]|nr:hypothetical protein [Candidatus Acidoferrales bacterium]
MTLLIAQLCQAADAKGLADSIPQSSKLLALAATKFPNLTHAERAMVWFSDIENIARGNAAFAGPSTNPDDPSNDPKGAEHWDHPR